MLNSAEILKALFGRVGWIQQPTNPVMALDADNLKSLSGRCFQDFHSVVSLQNILDTVDDVNIDVDGFNSHLKRLQRSSLLAGLSGIFGASDVVEQVTLFDRKDRSSFMPIAGGKLVGYRIWVAKNTSYSVHLRALSLLFDADDEITLRCIHSSAGELWSKTVSVSANKETIVEVDDLAFYYSSSDYKGGYFYIGYDQSSISAKAIDYTNPCWATSLIFGYDSFESSTELDNITLTGSTYGMSLELCSYRDFTEIVKRNSTMFDTLIGLQVAAAVVEQVICSVRSNKNERITKEQVMQLYNDLNLAYPSQEIPYTTGLKNKIRSEVDRLRKNFFPKPTSTQVTPCSF
jgi:hypothetical protein